MRSVIVSSSFLCIVFGLSFVAAAQDFSPEMVEAGKRVHDAFDQNLKGWARERVEPMYPDTNLIVENWIAHDRRVRISIAWQSPNINNEKWLADFLRRETKAKKVEGIGDAAVSWGYADSVITFHHERFNVSVSSAVDLNLLSRGKEENRVLSVSELAPTSRLLACFINLALQGDLVKDKPIPREGLLQRPCERELASKQLLGKELLDRIMAREIIR